MQNRHAKCVPMLAFTSIYYRELAHPIVRATSITSHVCSEHEFSCVIIVNDQIFDRYTRIKLSTRMTT